MKIQIIKIGNQLFGVSPFTAIMSPDGKAFDNSWIEHEIIGNVIDNPTLLSGDTQK